MSAFLPILGFAILFSAIIVALMWGFAKLHGIRFSDLFRL